jgi:hypothetical protein
MFSQHLHVGGSHKLLVVIVYPRASLFLCSAYNLHCQLGLSIWVQANPNADVMRAMTEAVPLNNHAVSLMEGGRPAEALPLFFQVPRRACLVQFESFFGHEICAWNVQSHLELLSSYVMALSP